MILIKTPAVAEIVKRLTSMVDYGADVAKMAVMPQSVEDVLTLLTATNIARQTLPQPVITMSMGDLEKCHGLLVNCSALVYHLQRSGRLRHLGKLHLKIYGRNWKI